NPQVVQAAAQALALHGGADGRLRPRPKGGARREGRCGRGPGVEPVYDPGPAEGVLRAADPEPSAGEADFVRRGRWHDGRDGRLTCPLPEIWPAIPPAFSPTPVAFRVRP